MPKIPFMKSMFLGIFFTYVEKWDHSTLQNCLLMLRRCVSQCLNSTISQSGISFSFQLVFSQSLRNFQCQRQRQARGQPSTADQHTAQHRTTQQEQAAGSRADATRTQKYGRRTPRAISCFHHSHNIDPGTVAGPKKTRNWNRHHGPHFCLHIRPKSIIKQNTSVQIQSESTERAPFMRPPLVTTKPAPQKPKVISVNIAWRRLYPLSLWVQFGTASLETAHRKS